MRAHPIPRLPELPSYAVRVPLPNPTNPLSPQVATHAPFLSHHITRFEEIIRDLAITAPAATAAAAQPAAVRA